MSNAFRLENDTTTSTATIVLTRPDDGNRLAPQDMSDGNGAEVCQAKFNGI